MPRQTPCTRCGACCAAYRISFDCRETSHYPDGVVPLELTVTVSATRSAMRGTEKRPFRCMALEGSIGRTVWCTIYDRRPTTCRDFKIGQTENGASPLCDQARARYGLTPLGGF